MNERVKFIARYLQHEEPFAALCEAAGISRKTGYKWVEHFGQTTARSSDPSTYPAHFRVQRVYPNGDISLGDTQGYLSNCLAEELVALEEVDDNRWAGPPG
jgi:hypothetical protein